MSMIRQRMWRSQPSLAGSAHWEVNGLSYHFTTSRLALSLPPCSQPLWCRLVGITVCPDVHVFCRCLDKAAVSGPGLTVSRTMVEETKAFLGIMPLFLCICIYQMAYDPIL